MDNMQGNRYKVYIYGMGNEYNKLASILPLYQHKLEILGIVTTVKQRNSEIDGYPCICVEEIDNTKMDYVIIAIAEWKEIMDILGKHGIGCEKIIRSMAFYYPQFDLDEYLKLKNNNVSILSNFCLGGVIYRELGLEMLSPTVNMFCLGKDYLEFIENYEYYLSVEMQEYRNERYIEKTLGVESFLPKGVLEERGGVGKVVWYFNHDVYASDAIKKWNERVKRVNMDNVAVIMTLQSDEDAYRFSELNIKKKLGIYYKQLGLQDVVYCPAWDSEEERFKYHGHWTTAANAYLSNSRGYVSPVNWIKFLNGENDYRRF